MKVIAFLALSCLCLVAAAYSKEDQLGLEPEVITYLPTPEFLMPEETAVRASGAFMGGATVANIAVVNPSIREKKNCKKKKKLAPKPKPQTKPANKAPPRRPQGHRPKAGHQNPPPQHQNSGSRRPGPNFKRRPGSKVKRDGHGTAKKSSPSKRVKGCTMQHRVCGSTCRKTPQRKEKCKVQVNVPKFCVKDVRSRGLCLGTNPKLCNYIEEEPDVCTRTKTTKVQCPDKTYSCDSEVTENVPCPKNDCKKWKIQPCKRRGDTKKGPCKKPSGKCKDCRRGSYFVTCKQKKWFRVEVPCLPAPSPTEVSVLNPSPSAPNPTESPPATAYPSNSPEPYQSSSPSNQYSNPADKSSTPHRDPPKPSPSPFAFPDKGPDVSSIRCFASYFDESECTNVSPHCSVTDKSTFDEEKCTYEACRACIPSNRRKSSTKLKIWCRVFRVSYCYVKSARFIKENATGGSVQNNDVLHTVDNWSSVRLDLKQSEKTSKRCFKKESRLVAGRCEKKLPGNEVCVNGCRVKACSKRNGLSRGIQGYCKDNLPPHCRGGNRKNTCKRKKTIKKTCTRPGKKECVSKVTEPYVCSKKKTVKRPCEKQPCKGIFACAMQTFHKKCSHVLKQKYACGTTTETKLTSCMQGGGSNCTPKYCTVKVCD